VIRTKSFAGPEPVEAAEPPSPEVVAIDVPETGASDAARVVARHEEERSGPKLDEAAVVVSGGRGLGSPDNYALIHRACAVVEPALRAHHAPSSTAGWVPYAFQVVRPARR